ncbi:formin-like protein 5 [Sphaerodactylus townsendi]|uniref:formin-like protein 5 n=1 Tax=Sphaerodactylus townsendi TaxID=933632 RepID=UPI002026BCE3|nr:formin-like protein 5 [Sphaerodactylus townsendi]
MMRGGKGRVQNDVHFHPPTFRTEMQGPESRCISCKRSPGRQVLHRLPLSDFGLSLAREVPAGRFSAPPPPPPPRFVSFSLWGGTRRPLPATPAGLSGFGPPRLPQPGSWPTPCASPPSAKRRWSPSGRTSVLRLKN